MRRAASEEARTIELTSQPAKEAANRLDQRLGFTRRETNVYRYACVPTPPPHAPV